MFEERLMRIMRALEVSNDSELARKLGIKPPSVASARERLKIPSGWIERVSVLANVTTDWLFFGRGPMHPGGQAQPQPEAAPPSVPATCAKCAILEAENRLLRELKASQEETIKAYKIALEARQHDPFRGDMDVASPIVPPCAQPAHIFNSNTK